MEVQFTHETEKRLKDLAEESGRGTVKLIPGEKAFAQLRTKRAAGRAKPQ